MVKPSSAGTVRLPEFLHVALMLPPPPSLCLWFVCRVKLETLTDKETAPEEEEEKEDRGLVEGQDQSEEALTASQPKPTLSRALLEDEEVSIEEYSSD